MKKAGIIFFVLSLGMRPGLAAAQEQSETQGQLSGKVENEKGQPVPEVKVRAISRRTDKLADETETDSDGTFTFSHLAEGRYALVFYSPSYQQATVPSVDVKAGQKKRLDDPVRLKPVKVYAVIEGAVFNSNGFLIPGARVRLERIPFEGEPISAYKQDRTANQGGSFAFRLPGITARYRLTASMKGYQTQSLTVDIGGNERRHVSIQLDPEP